MIWIALALAFLAGFVTCVGLHMLAAGATEDRVNE